MSRPLPQIIGIVGGSCAGKTWLAERLATGLGRRATRLSQDDFYFDRSHLSLGRRARLNFDHPRAIDWDRLETVLANCQAGVSVAVPRYDFATHSRRSSEDVIEVNPVIVVEGLWLFRRPSMRRLFSLKVFIRSGSELSVERRLRRDTVERGRTPAQVLEQWERYTQPMFLKFVAPQEKWADVVLEAPVNERDVAALVERASETSTASSLTGI
jgi:uridine kinase